MMSDLKNMRRLGQVALTALCIGTAAAAFTAWPLGNLAEAKNSDHGGQGADHGGGHGNGHDNGSHSNGGNGGNRGDAGGNGNGNANGHSNSGPGGRNGPSGNAGPGSAATDADTDVSDDDSSLSPQGLGKLNGFLHASPNALANASPNSSIGRIAHGFGDALSDYAKAQQEQEQQPSDGTGSGDSTTATGTTTPTGPTAEDLGAILAGATNKPVTAAQVQAIVDRLAELHPDDAALADFAASGDEEKFKDIADAANAARAGGTTTGDGTTTDDTTASAASE
jgi:hypothetical protein